MKIVLGLILLIIIILLYILFKSMNKSIVATIICTLFILQIIAAPKICIDSALSGSRLFMSKVFPSLFPFLVITGVMMKYNGVKIYSRYLGVLLCKPLRLPIQCTFSVIVSILCGYPLGAKYACDLYEEDKIDLETCQRLINIASNTSPLFAIGAVGTSMLNNPGIGYMLLLINYLSCFAISLFLPVKSPYKNNEFEKKDPGKNINFGSIMKDSIEESIRTCLSIGGFVILYSVLISIISNSVVFSLTLQNVSIFTGIEYGLLKGVILGIVEMTNGCHLISNTSAHIYTKVVICSFLLAFSGFSIISQVHSFTYKYKLSMKKYIVRKFLQGILASLIAIIIYNINILNSSLLTFSSSNYYSMSRLFEISIILLVLPLLVSRLRGLFHSP